MTGSRVTPAEQSGLTMESENQVYYPEWDGTTRVQQD